MQVAAAPRCATGNHMGFEHRAFEQEGHRLQEVIDGESGYRILVDNLGAGLVSIARRTVNGDWDGYLYRDGEVRPAERGWQNHATVMGYFLHRATLCYSLPADQIQRTEYPRKVSRRFSMRFS